MHTKLLLIFASANLVLSHDITIGSDTEGRKIFDEIRQANPAIWRQIENVTIVAPKDEVISRVVITDMRPEKDGDVQIVDGGEGKNNVTIELKSPTVLRGYEFHLEVYTVPETKLSDAEEHLYGSMLTTDKTDLSEKSETISEINGSGDEAKDSEMSDSVDKTTESAESSINKDIPASVGIVDGDILRPARETNNENNTFSTSENNSNLHPSVIGNEPDLTTTGNVKTEMDLSEEMTTETITTIKSENEEITEAPESFDNSKNIPDYPALSILDLIKSKESARRIRHTEDKINSDATTSESVVESTESVSTSVPTEESSSSSPNNDDDTVDLVPPVETDYNTEFSSNNENTETPLESSTLFYNKPRAGRGLDLSDYQEKSISTTVSDIETTTLVNNDDNSENTTVDVTIDEKLRNSRDARGSSEESNGLDVPTDSIQNEQTPSCGAITNDKPPNGNIIIMNGEQLTLTPDNNKLQFGIPIVLIIGTETSMPTIKIIAEAADEQENKDMTVQSPESTLEDNGPQPEYNLNEPQIRDEVSEEFVARPVMNYN